MRQLIAIKNSNGEMMLREVNPYDVPYKDAYPFYKDFEAAVKSYPAVFSCQEGEQFTEGVDVQLVYQRYHDDSWVTETAYENGKSAIAGFEVRQAYIKIEPKLPVKEKEPIFKQGASRINIKRILNSIQDETRPMKGHLDPGALQDCWDEIFDQFVCVYDHDEVLKIIGKVIERTAIWVKKNPSGIPILEVKYDDLLKKQR